MKELSKIMAPFTPFFAEDLYQKLRLDTDPLSVHLTDWPENEKVNEKVLKDMAETKRVVTLALEARSSAGIIVRQPVGKLEVRSLKLGKEYEELIKDEINVKEVVEDASLEDEVELDTTLTPELLEEGKLREVIREVQKWRKEEGLEPGERASYEVPVGEKEFFQKYHVEVERATNTTLSF